MQVADCRSRSLFLGDTESLTSTAGRLGLLTTDLNMEVMTKTSVLTSLLHAFKIFSESGINHVRDELTISTIFDTSLSVEEPFGDAIL